MSNINTHLSIHQMALIEKYGVQHRMNTNTARKILKIHHSPGGCTMGCSLIRTVEWDPTFILASTYFYIIYYILNDINNMQRVTANQKDSTVQLE